MSHEQKRNSDSGVTEDLYEFPPLIIEISMLLVFVGFGFLITELYSYNQFPIGILLVGLIIGTIGTEIVHEGLHWFCLRLFGYSGTIEWRSLAVIPYDQTVPRWMLFIVILAPVTVVTPVIIGGLYAVEAPLLLAILGYSFVMNATVSVVDVLAAIQLIRIGHGTSVHFGAAGDRDLQTQIIS